MPRRNYKIFDWKEGEMISDKLEDVKHSAQIDMFNIEGNNGNGGRYLLGITDEDNLDSSIMFGITISADGRITDFRDFTRIKLYSKISLEYSPFPEMKRDIVYVMGNDIGETMYAIRVEHQYISKAVEFEITVYPTEEISYIQQPLDYPIGNSR